MHNRWTHLIKHWPGVIAGFTQRGPHDPALPGPASTSVIPRAQPLPLSMLGANRL